MENNPIDQLKELTEAMAKDQERKRRIRTPLLILSLVISSVGIVMLVNHTSGWVCLAVVLLMWGNNIWIGTNK